MVNHYAKCVLGAALLFLIAGCSNGEAVPEAADAPSAAGNPVDRGHLEKVNAKSISGWAWDDQRPDEPVEVNIYDGDNLLATVSANEFRQDLLDAKKGDGKHRFSFATPASLGDGQPHTIHARIAGRDIELINSPKVLKFQPR